MLKKMVASALFAGVAAGLIAAVLQLSFVQPVLLEAELYENGTLVHAPQSEAHDSDAPANAAHDHDSHVHGENMPDLGGINISRDGLSLLFTIFNYTAFGLILVAGFAFAESRGHAISARTGVLWGLAGFISLQFAPAFGLPPELPGTAAADVISRQIWWTSTVVVTALGLWLLAYGKSLMPFASAIVLILAPHAIGAPHPATFIGSPPPELASLFASRALGVGMAAWACLGYFTATFWLKDAQT